jgi:hypothetical protein
LQSRLSMVWATLPALPKWTFWSQSQHVRSIVHGCSAWVAWRLFKKIFFVGLR